MLFFNPKCFSFPSLARKGDTHQLGCCLILSNHKLMNLIGLQLSYHKGKEESLKK